MPEASAFDAAWRVVKAYNIVPYESLTPTSNYARTDRMPQPSDPYIVHDDGRMPVREDRPRRDPRDAIRRLHEKVRRDPTSPHHIPRVSDLSDPTYYQKDNDPTE